jgi:hypothetical protein
VNDGIAYNQRVLVLGQTGSGKSELLNHLFSTMRCQRLLIDTKEDEWMIDGVEPAHTLEEIDWSEPIIHFAQQDDELGELDRVFAAARTRRGLVVCVHEMCDLCNYRANATPPNVSAFLSKGRGKGLGLIGGSQRPYEMPVRGRTEVQHVFIFVPTLGDDDVKAMAGLGIGIRSPKELAALIDQVEEAHGEHSFIWFRKGTRGYEIGPPLPEHVRRQSIVKLRSPL